MNYITLKAGDVRQEKDEIRWKSRALKDSNPDWCDISNIPKQSWFPCGLHGHAILSSDLMFTEYRRPQ